MWEYIPKDFQYQHDLHDRVVKSGIFNKYNVYETKCFLNKVFKFMLFIKICYKVITWLSEEYLHNGKRLYGFLKNNYNINFSLESCEEFKQSPTKTKSFLPFFE